MENHDNSAYLQAYFYANHIAYVVTDILDMLWLPEQILIAHILLMHALFVLLCTYIFYSFQSPRICPHPLIPYFEKKKLALQDVRIKDIENYYYHKATGGRLDGKPGGLSKSTLKHHRVILNLVFKKAMHDELVSNNPCQYAKIPKLEKAKSAAKFYTAEECAKLLELAEGTPLYDMVYITTIYGLRRSELLGIKWDAVDFKRKTLTIKHTVVLNTAVITCKDSTKNKTSMRTYPLLDDIEEILLRIKKQQDEYRIIFGSCYQESGYVFTKEDGSMRHPSYPSQMLTKTLKKNNMPHLRWHDLRHSCASILIMKGWQMKEISEWLRHADIGTTMNIYGHLNLDHKRKLGSTLNGLFDKNTPERLEIG